MDFNLSKFVFLALLATVLALTCSLQAANCTSSEFTPSESGKLPSSNELNLSLPQNDPELDLEAFKKQHQRQLQQMLRYRRHASLVRGQQQQLNNEADVAALLDAKQSLASGGPAAISGNNQQQMIDEEQVLRRQLPELLAQAHNDKVAERALLKMLISASLRSALSNMASQPSSSSPYYGTNKQQGLLAANANGWQQDTGAFDGNYGTALPRYQPVGGENYGSMESLTNDLGQSLRQQDQSSWYQSAPVDKREYIKPCSFNAISCAKNPFRKL